VENRSSHRGLVKCWCCGKEEKKEKRVVDVRSYKDFRRCQAELADRDRALALLDRVIRWALKPIRPRKISEKSGIVLGIVDHAE
jgi:hypothetical protein